MSDPVVYRWYDVTTLADREWKAALEFYWIERARHGMPWRPDICPEQAAIDQRLRAARAEYRRWVLSWFWKLVAPIGPGQCVPSQVAELLAEEWDLTTRAEAPR